MPNKKTVTAAEKAEEKPRHMMSRDMGKVLEVEEPNLMPPERGPMTGERQLTPVQYIERYATPDELAAFRATVQARRDRDGSVGWRQLPSGVRILANLTLALCTKCTAALWVKEGSGTCPTCNFRRLVDGGHLRPASAEEEAAWFVREETLQRKRIAALPKAKAELDEYNRRHLQDLPRDKDGRL